jgi:integrase
LPFWKKLRAYSGKAQYVFPSYCSETVPFGKTALQRAIRVMGFEREEMCPHGFRSMASTLLDELGCNADWIERRLAHVPHGQVRGIYNRAEYLPERRRMLQEWADYLDALREKAREERANA